MDKYKILIRPIKKNDLKPIMNIFESIVLHWIRHTVTSKLKVK